jgi:peptide/nickel transport system substrate-binding protein
VVKYIGDVNAIIAGVLGGDVDVVPMGSRINSDQVRTIRESWGIEGGFANVVPFRFRAVWLQFRDPTAPWVRNVRIRRALVHALDRQQMSDALQNGTAPVADAFIPPQDPAFKVLEVQGFPVYPFDLGPVTK